MHLSGAIFILFSVDWRTSQLLRPSYACKYLVSFCFRRELHRLLRSLRIICILKLKIHETFRVVYVKVLELLLHPLLIDQCLFERVPQSLFALLVLIVKLLLLGHQQGLH